MKWIISGKKEMARIARGCRPRVEEVEADSLEIMSSGVAIFYQLVDGKPAIICAVPCTDYGRIEEKYRWEARMKSMEGPDDLDSPLRQEDGDSVVADDTQVAAIAAIEEEQRDPA
jgi:hypothetical protein